MTLRKQSCAGAKTLLLLLLLITGTASYGQLRLPEGNYEVSLVRSVTLMSAKVKARYDTLPGHIKAQADASMTGKTFSFRPDGSVTIQWNRNGVAQTTAGTWQVTSAGSRLMIAAGGLTIEYLVEWEGSNGLILRNTKTAGLFTNMYLEKID